MMSRVIAMLTALEKHPVRVIWSIGTVFVVVYIASQTIVPGAHSRIINGDAIQYYAYLHSLTVDGDFDFTNDYRLLYDTAAPDASSNVWLTTVTPTGRAPNMMALGPAVLWAPAFMLVAAVAGALRFVNLGVPFNGVSTPFLLSAGVAGILYATAGIHLCYDMSRRLYPAVPALWATLAAWLATSAVYYSLVSPAYSHAVSLFAVSLFCHTWLRTRGRDGLARTATLGALAGLAALVRWQDIIVLILPLSEFVHATIRRDRSVSDTIGHVALLGVFALLLLVPQLVAWQSIYGQPMVMPQGEGFMRWTSPAVWPVLFSLKRGIVTWTPAVVLGVIGWRALVRRDQVLGWSAVAIGLVALYVNAAVHQLHGLRGTRLGRAVRLAILATAPGVTAVDNDRVDHVQPAIRRAVPAVPSWLRPAGTLPNDRERGVRRAPDRPVASTASLARHVTPRSLMRNQRPPADRPQGTAVRTRPR